MFRKYLRDIGCNKREDKENISQLIVKTRKPLIKREKREMSEKQKRNQLLLLSKLSENFEQIFKTKHEFQSFDEFMEKLITSNDFKLEKRFVSVIKFQI